MSYLKTNLENPTNRKQINTTIDGDILEEFKMACRKSGIQMNVLLELFMHQYCNGDFCLKFSMDKTKKELIIKDDEE